MDSKAKFLGHPVHPILIVFPLGLLATSLVFDIIALAHGPRGLFVAAYWMIAAGIIGGLLSAVFGLIDWIAIPSGTRAKSVGAWHGIGNVVVLAIFACSWFVRRSSPPSEPIPFAVGLSVVGVALALVTGWLGGELVDRLGVGVDDGANLNAPNSLSGRPTTSTEMPKHRAA
jgi:uncharacterized membrane protein